MAHSTDLAPEIYARAKAAAEALKAEIEPLILGKRSSAWQCDCGACGCGESVAVEICPAGDVYQYQIGMWVLWTVKMREVGKTADELPCGYSYSQGISEFLTKDQITELFQRHFEGIGVELR